MIKNEIKTVYGQMKEYFETKMVKFWNDRCIDFKNGGYFVDFDKNGNFKNTDEKYIVTQTRCIYGFSLFYKYFKNKKIFKTYAKTGYDFFIKYFWDSQNKGWIWRTNNKGRALDRGKLVYGQSFAIYALCEYYSAFGDKEAISYAEKTFEILQLFAADNLYGGYFENFTGDWKLEKPGYYGGDRKSLDIHMHLMEAYTKLYEYTGEEIYRRKLLEMIELIFKKMVHKKYICGLNQFDREWNCIPPIAINRTWNADRREDNKGVKKIDTVMTTSYGHNIELVWLALFAFKVLKMDYSKYKSKFEGLAKHAVKFGVDRKYGGIYRDGLYNGKPVVMDKEWWQQSESLIGTLYMYDYFGMEEYFNAFKNIWNFVYSNMINKELGEWYPLLTREGNIKWSDLGNPWKSIYHTGRSMVECLAIFKKHSGMGNGGTLAP